MATYRSPSPSTELESVMRQEAARAPNAACYPGLGDTRVLMASVTMKVRRRQRDSPSQHSTGLGTASAKPKGNGQRHLQIPPGDTSVPQLLPLLGVRSQGK